MLLWVKSNIKKTGLHKTPWFKYIYEKVFLLAERVYLSWPIRWIRRILDRFRKPHDIGSLKIAIVAHAFYPELIKEIIACRKIFEQDIPIYLTVPEDRVAQAEQKITGYDNITIHVVPNRGRDIAPFLAVLQSRVLDDYDAVLKLHTKRSPHLPNGNRRRRTIFLTLCGKKYATYRALSLFVDSTTGMVGLSDLYRTLPAFMMDNADRVEKIAHDMGATGPLRYGFFEGSMFWFRPSALEPLRKLNFQLHDFEVEQGQLDATLHHAVERCFTLAVWQSGMEVRDLHGRKLESVEYKAARKI